MSKINILFVCLGNICRSPAAEGIFAHQIKEKGLSEFYAWDSAGTSAYHHGEKADARMREHAQKRGIILESRSRAFKFIDFAEFDYIITMDDLNFRDVCNVAKDDADKAKVKKMVSYCYKFDDSVVPDPYYTGADGFEHVLDMLEEGCSNLIDELENTRTT